MLEFVESGSKNVEISYIVKGKQMESVSDDVIDRISTQIEAEKKEKEKKK